MGIAEIRDAFQNEVTPMFSCTQAYQRYVRENDVELQELEFVGLSSDGKPFKVKSVKHRPSDDPHQIARETALQFLNPGGATP